MMAAAEAIGKRQQFWDFERCGTCAGGPTTVSKIPDFFIRPGVFCIRAAIFGILRPLFER